MDGYNIRAGNQNLLSENKWDCYFQNQTAELCSTQQQSWYTLAETEEKQSLLFTMNSWVFPAGLSDEDPVLHFICG